MACAILENALQVVPANSALTAELTSYQETVRNQLRSSTLEAVEGSIAENDYPTAIQTLSSTLDVLNSDIELSALLEKYSGEYRDMIIAQADNSLENEGYEAAIAVVNEGLAVLINDTMLLQAIERYETHHPVNVSELKIIGSNATEYIINAEDIMGNVYDHAYEIGGNSPGKGYNYIEFVVGKEYNNFSAILVPSDTWRWREDYPTCTITIYGDDKVLASHDIYYKDHSLNIYIDVSEIDCLKVQMTSGCMWCDVLLVDAVVSK